MLQFLQPFTEAGQLWERFTSVFLSFDYALGTDKVLEELYQTDAFMEHSVLQTYKDNIAEQMERLLKKNGVSLVSADMEISNQGEILAISIVAQYLDGTEETENFFRIPTVAPVNLKEQEKKKKTVSPMELYIRELLAEFYQLEENKIEVVIQEAE